MIHEEDPTARYGSPHGDPARYQRIAENRGPIFPSLSAMVVEVVEPGTKIYGPGGHLVVDDENVVRNGASLYVTQRHWDILLAQTTVRYFV